MQRRTRQNQYLKLLLLALGVLVIALIVILILLLSGSVMSEHEREANLLETGRFIEGISVAGVDISGLSYAQALENETLQSKSKEFADNFTYTFTVAETERTFSAAELGLVSNLEHVLKDAMFFGQYGQDGAVLREQKTQAKEEGVHFDIGIYGDEEAVYNSIMAIKPQVDALPQDAMFDIVDDLKSDSGASYLIDLAGVTLIEEVVGADVDAAAFARLICNNVNSGNYSTVEAPAIITNPSMDAETLKANTKKIGEITTEFTGKVLGHPNRVANIRIMANIVNGTILKPGETWSINEAVGPRNPQTAQEMGWKEAPGISSGRYEDQIGGGVCQISSTVYNAAIRAEMTIVERKAHSWPSSYVDYGMDATISTGGPDLVIANPYDHPVYMVAYMNEEKFKVTVQFYGPPLAHGYTVEFSNELVGTTKAPQPTYHYNATTDPEGNPIGEGKTVTWVSPRDGQTWRVFKHYKDESGNMVKTEQFTQDVTYRSFAGVYYVNGVDASTVLPTLDDE